LNPETKEIKRKDRHPSYGFVNVVNGTLSSVGEVEGDFGDDAIQKASDAYVRKARKQSKKRKCLGGKKKKSAGEDVKDKESLWKVDQILGEIGDLVKVSDPNVKSFSCL
jgi:hypothetical protein